MLYGGVSMALALAMQLLGLFELGDARLQQSLSWILSDSFQVVVSEPVLFMLAAMFSFGIAFAVLDSPAAWRRIVLGLTALVLVLAMVPVCALWQIYFSPFFVVVAYFWAWFCTMMYTSQHVMPCEIGVDQKPHQPHVEIHAKPERSADSSAQNQASSSDAGGGHEASKPGNEPDTKYQPKE
jgi:hypothetical protein